MFKLGSVIFYNVLKELYSAQQGCIYLYSKKYMPDSRRESKKMAQKILLIHFKLNCSFLVQCLLELGLHDILHAIVMRISSVKTVLWLAVNLHQLFSDGAAFNTLSRSS